MNFLPPSFGCKDVVAVAFFTLRTTTSKIQRRGRIPGLDVDRHFGDFRIDVDSGHQTEVASATTAGGVRLVGDAQAFDGEVGERD